MADKNSLEGFDFNDEISFFNIKPGPEESPTSKVIREVKGEATEDETNEKVTKLEEGAKPDNQDDEEEEDLSFFEEEKPEDKKDKPEEGKDKPEPTKAKAKVKVEEEPESPDTEEVEGAEEEETEDEDEKDVEFYTTLTKEMQEKGIFSNVEIKEGEKINIDKFFELQDAELEVRLEEGFKEFAQDMDEDGKNFIKFKRDGGESHKFISVVTSRFDLTELDESDPKQVEKTLKHYIKNFEKITDETEIEDKISWLKESGKDKTYAAKYFRAIKDGEKEEMDAIMKEAAENKKKSEENAKKFAGELADTLKDAKSVGIFTFSTNDKKDLTDYINKPSVKIGTNKYVPQFMSDLSKILKGATPEDKQKLLILGKLIRNDFKTEDLVQKVETKVVSKIKSKLKESKENGIAKAAGGSGSGKQIADYF